MKRVSKPLPHAAAFLRGTTAGIRVEWFCARERSRRWAEEVQWLQREAATVVLDFKARAAGWKELQFAATHGASAYASKQSALWSELSNEAAMRLSLPLQVCHIPSVIPVTH